MAPAIHLINRGPITIESALEEEDNVINWASYGPATEKFFQQIWHQRSSVEGLVRQHMGLGNSARCVVLPPDRWIRGSFNVCVIVEVNSSGKKVIFRCPMAHKLAEARYQGSIDEKLGCEVGAHIWVEENCPEIRSPHLFGFGFTDGRQFTHAKHMSVLSRVNRYIWRAIYKLFRLPLLSHYVQNRLSSSVSSAYMVLEHFGPDHGQMLSKTFNAQRGDEDRRHRLFKGISQIILSLARIPQVQIGSFRFYSNGTIDLTNRPLSCAMMILENDGATRTIQPNDTFTCTDAFASEMLTFHDQRFLSQRNAVYNEDDCRGQMAVMALLRVASHNYIKRNLRSGPFYLQLTDFHASNIFVDDQWNVTGLIDLEWICALPSEMLETPYWLTGCSIDHIKGEELIKFNQVRQEFMRVFEAEEQDMKPKSGRHVHISGVMKDMWESKGVWFWYCISSVNAMYFLLESHLYPQGSLTTEAENYVSRFWCTNAEEIVKKKLADKEAYDDELRRLFDTQGP